jgi:hypothetical protein
VPDWWLLVPTYVFARKTLGQSYVPANVSVTCLLTVSDTGCSSVLSLTSFFNALSSSRSMSNSLETALTTTVMCYYFWGTLVLPSRYAG